MTYQETLTYMYSQLPMYQRQGAVALKKDLGNIMELMVAMGSPHEQLQCVHIAGTNGKGTTAHLIAAGLQPHGLKVGMYTSPHYIDFRERIKINGSFITEQSVVAFVKEYRSVFERVRPSFFEMTVAMAFHYFTQQQVDVAIIEVGLGGRLDSTNIITPILSVITNISYDHQAMLGDTLPLIAAEKAGIIKPAVPVVVGEYQSEVAPVFADKARLMNVPLTYADQHVELVPTDHGVDCMLQGQMWLQSVQIDITSSVQKKNLTTAIYALSELRTMLNLNPNLITEGLSDVASLTYYIGRYQLLSTSPKTIADSAHNVAGVAELMQYIAASSYENLHIVIGVVADKDLTEMLTMLPTDAMYYYVKADIPRGLATAELCTQASVIGLRGTSYGSVAEGYTAAQIAASTDDLVLVMGSIFVVAEVLSSH